MKGVEMLEGFDACGCPRQIGHRLCRVFSSKLAGRHHLEPLMRGVLIIVFEPGADLLENKSSVRQIRQVGVVTLQCLHKGFRHTVRFRRVGRRITHEQPALLSVLSRWLGNEGGTVVRKPLDWSGRRGPAEAGLHGLRDEVANIAAVQGSVGRDPSDGLPVAAVEAERDVHLLAVPAAKLKSVRAPPQVARQRHDLTVVRPQRAGARPAEQKALATHHTVHALVVHT